MKPLDVQGELNVRVSEKGVSVALPLAEPGDWADWMGQYNALAPSQGVDAQVEPQPGGVILRVGLSGDSSREQTFEILDRAVALVERAKEEASRQQETARAVDGYVREWWSGQGEPNP